MGSLVCPLCLQWVYPKVGHHRCRTAALAGSDGGFRYYPYCHALSENPFSSQFWSSNCLLSFSFSIYHNRYVGSLSISFPEYWTSTITDDD